MTSIMKVLLVLTVMFCISSAYIPMQLGSQCLCQQFRNRLNSKSQIKDIQIYSATIFCDKVEIVISLNNGNRYCLNPKKTAVKNLLAKVMGKNKTPSARPTEISSMPGRKDIA